MHDQTIHTVRIHVGEVLRWIQDQLKQLDSELGCLKGIDLMHHDHGRDASLIVCMLPVCISTWQSPRQTLRHMYVGTIICNFRNTPKVSFCGEPFRNITLILYACFLKFICQNKHLYFFFKKKQFYIFDVFIQTISI